MSRLRDSLKLMCHPSLEALGSGFGHPCGELGDALSCLLARLMRPPRPSERLSASVHSKDMLFRICGACTSDVAVLPGWEDIPS